jgi:foldase protein PrsA
MGIFRSQFISVLFVTVILVFGACKKAPAPSSREGEKPVAQEASDQHIQVQHILIGFAGTLPGKNLNRNQADAEKLAFKILEEAKAGGDFDALVKQYTDDSAPGIYGMSNRGVSPSGQEFPRDQMVPAFGDIGFSLKVGELGIASYDKAKSPFGYHIIKRLK